MNKFSNHIDLTVRINEIIDKRLPLAKQVKLQADHLESLRLIIEDLEDKCNEIKRESNDITDIDFPIIQKKISQEQKEFNKVLKRFRRKTLNIGVVGIARQGKSEFLKTLSGLKNNSVIPSSSGMPCTSVQSTIYHHSKEEIEAKVYFYSKSSFMKEVIIPYYEELKFPTIPQSFEDFIRAKVPELESQKYDNPTRAKSLYKNLRNDYYEHRNDYKKWLEEKPKVEKITENEISKFVSQEYDKDNNPCSFEHLAVREVKIFCPFPKVAVEKLGLVDMPGLGDTRLGDRQRMIKALGEDADFILFVRKPVKHGDKWGEDVELRDSAYQALKDKLPLEDWSFMVLNHDGENMNMCRTMKATGPREGIHFAEYIIANCMNDEEANQVLNKVLGYLVTHIEELDEKYLNSWKKSLKVLQNEVSEELNKARNAIKKYGNEHSEYVDLFQKFWKTLNIKLEDLRIELLQQTNEPDSTFKEQIDEAIKNCKQDKGIPSIEDIKSYYKENPSIGGTYDRCLHEIRSNTLKNFHSVEKGLKKSLDHKKKKVVEILQELGLGNITGNCNEIEFLQIIENQLPTELSNLNRGFFFLWSFDFLYKGFIQSIVWQHLREFLPPEGDIATVKAMLLGQCIQQMQNSILAEGNQTTAKTTATNSQDIVNNFPFVVEPATITDILEEPKIKKVLDKLSSPIEPPKVAAKLAIAIVQGLLNNIPSSLNLTQVPFDAKVIHATLNERYQQAIDKCEKALNILAHVPTDVGRSMIEEFTDHVLRTKDARQEWDKFLGQQDIRSKVWPKLGEIENRKQMQQDLFRLLNEAELVNRGIL